MTLLVGGGESAWHPDVVKKNIITWEREHATIVLMGRAIQMAQIMGWEKYHFAFLGDPRSERYVPMVPAGVQLVVEQQFADKHPDIEAEVWWCSRAPGGIHGPRLQGTGPKALEWCLERPGPVYLHGIDLSGRAWEHQERQFQWQSRQSYTKGRVLELPGNRLSWFRGLDGSPPRNPQRITAANQT